MVLIVERDKKELDWAVGDTLISKQGIVYMICEDCLGYFLVNLETGECIGDRADSIQILIDNCIEDGDRKINLRCEIQDI